MKKVLNIENDIDFIKFLQSNFSIIEYTKKGLTMLYNYLIELEKETGQELFLDGNYIFNKYIRFKNIKDFYRYYNNNMNIRNIEDPKNIKGFLFYVDEKSFIIDIEVANKVYKV